MPPCKRHHISLLTAALRTGPAMSPSGLNLRKPEIRIRDARTADALALLSMIEDLAKHHGDVPTVTLAELENDLFSKNPWSRALIASAHSKPVGCAVLQRLYRANHGERGIELTNLFVVEESRGLGIGKRLLEAAIERAHGWSCTFFSVGTHPENLQAQRFYEYMGLDISKAPGPRFHHRL